MNFKEYFNKNKVNLSDREVIAVKVGGLITAARIHAELSQAELAKKINTQQPSVARAEAGEVIASIEFLYKIAKAIKTDFIFPTFGFMKERENTATFHLHINTPEKYKLSPYTSTIKKFTQV